MPDYQAPGADAGASVQKIGRSGGPVVIDRGCSKQAQNFQREGKLVLGDCGRVKLGQSRQALADYDVTSRCSLSLIHGSTCILS